MLRKLSLAILIPLCMLTLYLVLVVGEYLYENDQVRGELAERQVNQIKQQLFRMQTVVQSAQALQDVERIEQEVSLAALDMSTMVYILVDADSRIRFANHTVWRDSNAIQVIDGYDVMKHHAVVQSSLQQISVNLERLTIQAYYPVVPQYPGAVELIYLESDLAPLVSEASAKLQQRFIRVWGLGGLLLIGFTLILYYLLIRPFKMLSETAKQVGTAAFSTQIPWSSAEVLSLQSILQLVHERLGRAVKQLNDSEQRWLFAVEGSRNGIWDWDIGTGQVFLSDRWKEMIGYAPDELEGSFQIWETRLHPEDRQAVLDCLQEYLSGKSKEFESVHRLKHRDGHYVWVLDRGMLVDWDHQGRPTRMIGIHVDVSESEKNHAAIAQLVENSVAGHRMLPATFMERLSQFLIQRNSSGYWGGFFFVEVECFGVTDSLTPHELERLFAQLGARLSSYFTENIIVGHLEAGRFVLLSKELGIDAEMAGRRGLALATELRQIIARPFHYAEHHFELNANVGIYLLDSVETLEPSTVLHRAKLAKQTAKLQEQAGCAFYHAGLDKRQSHDELLQQELKIAIEQDKLSLMFQPVVDVNGDIISAEILSRWYLANGEVISPAKFILLAERSGLIAALDLSVFRRACLLLQQAKGQGLVLPRMTINISSLSFCQVGFIEHLLELVSTYALDANQLGIELTETTLLMQETFVNERITKLSAAGVPIILDSFGVGQSALSSLMKYPVSAVKLDINCEAMASSLWQSALIQSLQAFEIQLVAKGIESVKQQQVFAALGCHAYQGYCFSRPLNFTDFKQLVCPRPLLHSV
ncbi:EAL domain-containing protein [Shewanella sp. CG12_big_fil_rev_8_21_14_0_65_47_15]|uniref:EAL domain-containing protein n=1 Tax=Shewanella sp. CG12_big_fil_rev_8_21_14_0_65_47_15 TaxID=1975537 RepID=UPI000CA7F3E6|nr:EAL domain-containing protein [Shewanella sp. CG12_big_fil_rev_8_21_14_0_65_47_15]PIW60264.1 MAG: sensor domain-containing phosphodiesterase [Shewanella sp. CG12_big_fil_rev_8_21_14_0_65_47_15]